MKSSKKMGFTLIELIVVLAILAIIAALAIPSFNGLKADARKSVADANARTVYTAACADKAIDGTVTEATTVLILGYSANFEADNFTILMTNGEVTGATWTGADKVTGQYGSGTALS